MFIALILLLITNILLLTDTTQITLAALGSASTIILSLGTLIGTIRNSGKHDLQIKKQDELHEEAKIISNQTNGTLTAMRAELSAALSKIETLERAFTIIKETKLEQDKDKEIIKREALEATIMPLMQEVADTKVELIKAKVSPAIDPKDL